MNRVRVALGTALLAIVGAQPVYGEDTDGERDPPLDVRSPGQTGDGAVEASASPPPPVAATSPAAGAETISPARRSAGIEEIVVTAQKRAENLQDVPIVVNAYTGEKLLDLGISSTQALQNATPGLVYHSNAGFAQAYVRGIGSDATFPTADPSVATYVDGVYYPFIQSTIQSFADLDRIEVLKGPQGTLYGRNATGGAINIVTRDPSFDEVEYSLKAERGNFDKRRVSLFASTPFLANSGAVAISGFYERADPYYRQINPDGPEIIDFLNWAIRLKGSMYVFQDLKVSPTIYRLRHEGADTNVSNMFDPFPVAEAFGAFPTPTPYVSNTDLPETNFLTHDGGDLKLAYEGIPWFDVKSITGYQDTFNAGFVDFDDSPAPAAGFGAQPGVTETFSQELQLLSKDLDWLEWVVGAFYLDSSGGFVPLNFWVATPAVGAILPDLPGVPPIDGPTDGTYTVTSLDTIIDTEAYAFFGQATWSVFDWLGVTGGLRYSKETRDFVKNVVYLPYLDDDPRNADGARDPRTDPALVNDPRSADFDDLSPKVGLDLPFEDLWIADSLLLYFSWTEGFKSGTFNPVRLVDTEPPPPVRPEEITSYEVGFKSDLLGRSLRLNASAFLYDYTDLQLQFIELTSGGAVRFENAGEATVKGIDAEFIWAPAHGFLEGLQLSFGASFLDSVYDVCNCTTYDPETGTAGRANLAGNELVRAPKLTASSQLSYRIAAPGGPLEAAMTFYHNDGFFFDPQNTFRQNSYQLFGALLSYTLDFLNTRLSLFGNNLANEEYLVGGAVSDFGTFGTFAIPRTFGGRLQWPAG